MAIVDAVTSSEGGSGGRSAASGSRVSSTDAWDSLLAPLSDSVKLPGKPEQVEDKEYTPARMLRILKELFRARLLDEKAIILYKQNKAFFHVGCAGHEGVQVAAAQVFRSGHDWFYPYYRDLGLVTALGMTDRQLLLNFMNKPDDINSGGRQMPMHYSSTEMHIVSQSSPTGTQYNQAVGTALGAKTAKTDEVVYVSSGDGTCAQGDFHEALNWASRDKLPVVFVIENNDYAISVPLNQQIANESIAKLMSGYKNLKRIEVDGTNFMETWNGLKQAHEHARNGNGPALVEAHVPRLQSHSISDNHLKYRSEDDVKQLADRCPLKWFAEFLVEHGVASEDQINAIREKVRKEIDDQSLQVEKLPDGDPETVLDHVYKNPEPAKNIHERSVQEEGKEPEFLVDALNHTLHEEMERDERILVYGQDVADGKGGVFTVTKGLSTKYGKRCFNSQLAESSIVGVAIGLACYGFRPVAEIQFGDYVWTSMMQIRNELAMMHYRSNGAWNLPVVLRIPVGGYIRGAAYHSQTIEATFSHFPGLHVVFPSNARDARGMLKSAIRGTDPVLFLEHKGLYRQPYAKAVEGGADDLVPLGKAKVVREGTDLTLISWGLVLHKSLVVAKQLEQAGHSIEVIDVRSMAPLDMETILASVKKTNRALIVHEDSTFMGYGAEIAAQLADRCFEWLDAPIRRIGMKPVAHVPHPPGLEAAVLLQDADIREAIEDLMAY